MEDLDLFNNYIAIEDCDGNTIMKFKVTADGKILEMQNCDIADIDNGEIRIQAIDPEM